VSGRTLSRRNALAGGFCLCCAPARAGETDMAEVAPGIHIRRGVTADAAADNADAIANIGFIVGRESVAVMDPGGSLADGQSLRRAIRRTTALPIRTVILSHVHPDHVFGAGAFQQDNPAFIGHAKLPEALAARGDYYRTALDAVLGPGRAGPVVMPTQLVQARQDVDLGGRVLSLQAQPPAHTNADLSVTDRQTGILLTGDLLFVGRVPALDGNLAGWLDVLKTLKADGATNAVPGHGPTLVAWPAAAADLTRYLTVLQRETREAVAAGVPIQQAARTVAASERTKWALFDAYNARNVIEAYRQIEWE
jgi:quinoprotein relay system zinc metallohydrolase 2